MGASSVHSILREERFIFSPHDVVLLIFRHIVIYREGTAITNTLCKNPETNSHMITYIILTLDIQFLKL